MRDEHDGAAVPLPDRNKLFLHFELCLRIERREWLVHQDDARVHQQRPRNAYALVHSARQFGGVMMFEAPQADQIDVFHGSPRRSGFAMPLSLRENATLSIAVSQGINVGC